MKSVILIGILLAAFIVVSSSSAGNPDPRKCAFNNTKTCAQTASVTALRKFMAARTGHLWSGHGDIQWGAYNLTCKSGNSTLLLWSCTWTSTTKPNSATVRFWATSTGWHARVTVQ